MEPIAEVANVLSTTDIINVTLCILSFLLSAISVVAVVLTLRQNNKMIEASTRPYINVSYEIFYPGGGPNPYIVIKNYGATGARITSFECNVMDTRYLDQQFEKTPGIYLAPGQKIMYFFKHENIDTDLAIFKYSYTSGKKFYSETQELRIKTAALTSRSYSDSVSYSLQDIAERLL